LRAYGSETVRSEDNIERRDSTVCSIRDYKARSQVMQRVIIVKRADVIKYTVRCKSRRNPLFREGKERVEFEKQRRLSLYRGDNIGEKVSKLSFGTDKFGGHIRAKIK